MNIEEKKEPTHRVWQSCCFECDKDASVFFSIYFIIVSVVGFCFYQLTNMPDCSDQQTYVGVLSLILGVLLPQPKIKG